MNRKQLGVVMAAGVVVAVVLGAGIYGALQAPETHDHRWQVVATFYPLAYMTQAIGGEHVSVHTLVPANTDIHSWQPSFSDIYAADNAHLLVYNGAHLDPWFEEDVLPALDIRDSLVVNTTANVSLISGRGTHGVDPHTWVAPPTAHQQARSIYEALVYMDPAHQEYYSRRWENLSQRLTDLDHRYAASLASAPKDVIFVTHAAYGYLAQGYGLTQYAITGISADEQPSTAALKTLVDSMEYHHTYVLYVNPLHSEREAQALKQTLEGRTGQPVTILRLYVMLGPMDGLDYLQQMEQNLENLKTGLGAA
ncbi:MAG TPA: hypothetical protein ENN54_06165 [Thermoplasmatales archaeon]|nr:hypothetical protein [Thermoplasmatales archaeon]